MHALHLRLFLCANILSGGIVCAQSTEQWIAWGDAAFAKEEYYGASRFYAGALQQDAGRMSLQWKQAEACRLSNQYPQAIALYERVHQKDMGRTYPEAFKWLGEMQLCDGRYDDARATWKKIDQKEKDKTSVLARRAWNALAGCDRAGTPSTDTTLEIAHLPGPVNTFDSEFAARTGPDSILWFSSLRGDVNDDGEVEDTASYHVGIYSSKLMPQGWNEPMREAAQADAMGTANANLMWTTNGDRMYFTMIDVDGTKHIATRTPNSPAKTLTGLEAHPDATQPWATVINDKAVLLFAASGGEGGMDIWYGDLSGDAVSNITNAGQLVNSPGNEISPSFDATSNVLWFSSDFHAGIGGFDIFRINWQNDPDGLQNMLALNSPANDLYPVFDSNTGMGWFTSNRKGSFAAKGETCCNDIYRIQSTPKLTRKDTTALPTDSIAIIPSSHIAGLVRLQREFPLKLYFHNDEPEPRTRSISTKQTYGATYESYTRLFDTYRAENSEPASINAFIHDEAQRGRAKLDELTAALITALENGERITLDVRGHASPLALNDYNQNLSLRRIETLRNHLRSVDSGILMTYMDSMAANGAVLRLRVLPFGEDRSAVGVSDDVKDLKRSVYSTEAARERRIEVEAVHVEEAGVILGPAMNFSIGTVRQGVPKDFEIPVTNTGAAPLKIIRGRSSCDCVQVTRVPDAIPPGGTGIIGLQYSGRTRPGPLERLIQLDIDGSATPLELTVKGNVTE